MRGLYSKFKLAADVSEGHRDKDANGHLTSIATAVIKHVEYINKQLNAAAAGRSISRKPVVVHQHADGAMPTFPHDDARNEWAFLRKGKPMSLSNHLPANSHSATLIESSSASEHGHSIGSDTTAFSSHGAGSNAQRQLKSSNTSPSTSKPKVIPRSLRKKPVIDQVIDHKAQGLYNVNGWCAGPLC